MQKGFEVYFQVGSMRWEVANNIAERRSWRHEVRLSSVWRRGYFGLGVTPSQHDTRPPCVYGMVRVYRVLHVHLTSSRPAVAGLITTPAMPLARWHAGGSAAQRRANSLLPTAGDSFRNVGRFFTSKCVIGGRVTYDIEINQPVWARSLRF